MQYKLAIPITYQKPRSRILLDRHIDRYVLEILFAKLIQKFCSGRRVGAESETKSKKKTDETRLS